MKAKIPKAYENLPQSERDKIVTLVQETVRDLANKQVDEDEANLQIVWMKLCCILLHDTFGFGESRLNQFVGNWKRIYRKNAKLGNKQAQDAWFAEELAKCFPKSGFPADFVEKLKEIG